MWSCESQLPCSSMAEIVHIDLKWLGTLCELTLRSKKGIKVPNPILFLTNLDQLFQLFNYCEIELHPLHPQFSSLPTSYNSHCSSDSHTLLGRAFYVLHLFIEINTPLHKSFKLKSAISFTKFMNGASYEVVLK